MGSARDRNQCDRTKHIKRMNQWHGERMLRFVKGNRIMESDKKVMKSSDQRIVDSDYIDALEYVVHVGSASLAMIQRKCDIGYNKAGQIMEWMEEKGYVSAFDGAKARTVFLSLEDFELMYGENAIKLEALELVVGRGSASVALLQRRLGLALHEARKIIDWMEFNGFISTYDGKSNRTVFLTMEKFKKLYKNAT